ncbi:hypothetical protein ACFX13_002591 [Malus domestica]
MHIRRDKQGRIYHLLEVDQIYHQACPASSVYPLEDELFDFPRASMAVMKSICSAHFPPQSHSGYPNYPTPYRDRNPRPQTRQTWCRSRLRCRTSRPHQAAAKNEDAEAVELTISKGTSIKSIQETQAFTKIHDPTDVSAVLKSLRKNLYYALLHVTLPIPIINSQFSSTYQRMRDGDESESHRALPNLI